MSLPVAGPLSGLRTSTFSPGTSAVFLRIDSNGILTRFAGNPLAGYSGDGGPAINATLRIPDGSTVAVDGVAGVVRWMN